MIGHKVDLSYSYDHLGEDVSILKELANGTHPFCKVKKHMQDRYALEGILARFCCTWIFPFTCLQALLAAKRPVVVVGSSSLQREDGAAILSVVSTIAQNARSSGNVEQGWKVLNILQRYNLTSIDILKLVSLFFLSSATYHFFLKGIWHINFYLFLNSISIFRLIFSVWLEWPAR